MRSIIDFFNIRFFYQIHHRLLQYQVFLSDPSSTSSISGFFIRSIIDFFNIRFFIRSIIYFFNIRFFLDLSSTSSISGFLSDPSSTSSFFSSSASSSLPFLLIHYHHNQLVDQIHHVHCKKKVEY